MIFSSSIFLLYFLPLFLLIYYFIKERYKNYVILIASVIFYSWGAPKFVFVILGSTILDFYLVRALFRSKSKKIRKVLLTISISLNLGLLFFFKYANFFIENINVILESFGANNVTWTQILLPIGISFYTFQTLTYSIDVYNKRHDPLKKISSYLLYIMSFPQMIAGPIVRYVTIADQIEFRNETTDDRLIGFYRFCIGLGKKVLIANVMGEQADIILNGNLDTISTSTAWLGILAYTFQIYFDFSGYSDMAIGLGRLMGFKFPENFNSPYIASNISEFWRRWHITLGAFMRDYLYIPLGGNRVSSKARLYFNLWLVFLLSGFWHGASWNFIIWGAYHGLFLILDRLFLIKLLNSLGNLLSTIITFFIVMVGWAIFRLEDFSELKKYMWKLFSFDFHTKIEVIPSFNFILIVAIFFSFLTLLKRGKNLEGFFFRKESYTLGQNTMLTILSIVLFTLSLSSITATGFNPFIYFRF